MTLTLSKREYRRHKNKGGQPPSPLSREKMEKEYLYVGYYIDTEGRYILKIGTTGNLKRRKTEHTRNYRRAPQYVLPADGEFQYLWSIPLSKYNTLRYEDRNRQAWQNANIGEYVRNDRFVLLEIPRFVSVTIRKTYNIALR